MLLDLIGWTGLEINAGAYKLKSNYNNKFAGSDSSFSCFT